MIELYVLRHAVAESREAWAPKSERARPLTRKGEKQMYRVAEGMKNLDLSFDVIFSSPFVRAKRTAEIVAEVFRAEKKLKLTDSLKPGAHPKKFVEQARHLFGGSGRFILVGHEPFLSGLISILSSGDARVGLKLKKGGLCRLELNTIQPGGALLHWLLTPDHLEKLS